jgi:hypothetical protein
LLRSRVTNLLRIRRPDLLTRLRSLTANLSVALLRVHHAELLARLHPRPTRLRVALLRVRHADLRVLMNVGLNAGLNIGRHGLRRLALPRSRGGQRVALGLLTHRATSRRYPSGRARPIDGSRPGPGHTALRQRRRNRHRLRGHRRTLRLGRTCLRDRASGTRRSGGPGGGAGERVELLLRVAASIRVLLKLSLRRLLELMRLRHLLRRILRSGWGSRHAGLLNRSHLR